ncbi:MAG: nitroreductase family protein [Deltaproteobacteria bacterium]|nr:nitroreductase family protein [Deltaproteobacteria bacterium]
MSNIKSGGADIQLTAPDIHTNRILKILRARQTTRVFSPRALSPKTVSNLLYAANGVNRSREGSRTAPSAHNWRYIDIYLADARGLFLYDAQNNSLKMIRNTDLRAHTGLQDYAAQAPLNLVYVLDRARIMETIPDTTILLFGAATTGAISQNVYMYAASEHLSTVVRADIDREKLHKEMKLRDDQEILLAQSVGHTSTVDRIKNIAKKILQH